MPRRRSSGEMDGSNSREVVSARRRLIRGTFAAPALLALHSGSAIAGASSNLRCLEIGAQPTAVVPAGTDTIVRVALYKPGSASSGGPERYLKGADVYSVYAIATRVGVSSSFLPSGSYWRQVTVTNGLVTLGAPSLDAPSGQMSPAGEYIALRFAPGATTPVEVVGVIDGNSSTLGSAASIACWNSFAGI
jgi:hypothetical protein